MSTLQDFLDHPIETLERALHLRKQIDHLNKTLKDMFGRTSASLLEVQPDPTASQSKGRRKMSAAGRKKIAAAQRARWAKSKGPESATPARPVKAPAVAKSRKKGGMSAEGRARIVAAQKKRWAKVKAAKAAPAKAAPKARKKKGKSIDRKGRKLTGNEGQPQFRIL